MCTVLALVLLNRLLSQSNRFVPVHAFNWRLLYLCALLIGQKIWDDVALANVDFPIIWKHAMQISEEEEDRLDVKAFNAMELKMLELLQFNVYVSSGLYAQFCFELRSIYEANSPASSFPVAPLSQQDAKRLEFVTG